MNLAKMIRFLVVLAVLACGFLVTSSTAQPGRASWYGNNGRHLGWSNGRHRGWDKDRGWRGRNVVYYRPARYRYTGYRNYYPNYGYGGSSILGVLLGNSRYNNSGYRGRYYYRRQGDWDDHKWRKHFKHHRRWDRD